MKPDNRQARIIPPLFEGGRFLFEIRENGRFCQGGELPDDNLLS